MAADCACSSTRVGGVRKYRQRYKDLGVDFAVLNFWSGVAKEEAQDGQMIALVCGGLALVERARLRNDALQGM